MSSPLLASPLKAPDPPSWDVLATWLRQNGAKIDERLVVGHSNASGYHVSAREDIERGEVLCIIPKSLAISHRTSSLAPYLSRSSDPTAAEATLHLASCLLHELRLGTESPFWAALQMLPRETVLVPTFWGIHELCGDDGREGLMWLSGTEAERELIRKRDEGLGLDDIKAYFDAHSSAFLSTQSSPFRPTLYHYLYALSMVFTRAFVVDAYHTIALIPFCDLFNHSTSFSHTSLLSDQCVCPVCGSLAQCRHDDPGQDRLDHLDPVYVQQTEKEGRNVEMRAERRVTAGEQVFSCYEEGLSAGKLLVEWGFVTPERGGVRWKPQEVLYREEGRRYMEVWQRGQLLEWFQWTHGEGAEMWEVLRDWVYWPDNPGDFGLNWDGEISMNVLIALAVGLTRDGGEEQAVEKMIVGALEWIFEIVEEDVSELDGRLRRAMMDLLDGRQAHMFRPDTELEELEAIIQAYGSGRPLTAMAMTLSSDERLSLSIARNLWTSGEIRRPVAVA